jgi:HEPN domain-containing protein
MPLDPIRVADVLSWLSRAARDLAAGDQVLQASPPLTGDAAFHSQQAAEKALKAFLLWQDEPFRKTHSLEGE